MDCNSRTNLPGGAMSSRASNPRSHAVAPPPAARTSRRKRSSDDAADAQKPPVKKSRTGKAGKVSNPPPNAEVIDLTGDGPARTTSTPKKQKTSEDVPERRLRRYRHHPPRTYLDRLARVRTQRMFVVGHDMGGTDAVPEISFDIVGSTGNLYKVVIGKVPTCDCPDARKGNQCKHICYVLVNALKAPSHLQYQLAFLSSELREMYEDSPLSQEKTASAEDNGGNRKPLEGDCPICFMEFEPSEDVVWCRAACGNNVHKSCFEQWAATTRSDGVRCVYCRTDWEYDDPSSANLESIKRGGPVNEEGYVNVAAQFGMSGQRDYSTYSQFSTFRASSYYGRRSRRYYGYDNYDRYDERDFLDGYDSSGCPRF